MEGIHPYEPPLLELDEEEFQAIKLALEFTLRSLTDQDVFCGVLIDRYVFKMQTAISKMDGVHSDRLDKRRAR